MEIIKDKKILKIIEKIKNAIKLTRLENHVFITGGAIRDSILNTPIKDLDLVVDVEDGGIVVANLLAAKEKCYVMHTNPVIFPTYGTAKVCLFKDEDLKDINIEFVEARKCAYELGKKCLGTLEEDSKRRDLTINSLYWNINDGKLYDYNQAIDDMTTQTLRTVDPSIFAENPIKMMRVIRFSAEFGWDIEKDTWLGIIQHYHLIKNAPKELISAELSKILTSPNPSVGIRKLRYCGLLKMILPDIYDLNSVYESKNPAITVFDHTMNVLNEVQPFIENRLAALFHDVGSIVTQTNRTVSPDMFSGEVAASELLDLRFPKDVCNAVETAIRYHRIFKIYGDGITPPDGKIRKFINLCGDNIGTTLDLMNANNLHCTYGKKKRQVMDVLARMEKLEEIEKDKKIKLPIDGNDILAMYKNMKPGGWIAKALDAVKEAYYENPNITREECLEIARKQVKVLILA